MKFSNTSSNKSRSIKSKSVVSNAFSKLKVVKPTLSNLESYEFACGLHPEFLDNLSIQVGLSGGGDQGGLLSVDDDLKLESYFLQQALAAVSAGRSRLESCGRVFTRPSTYHAHLLKTVSHLQRIAKADQSARSAAEASAEAKRQRLLKATAKKVQIETIQGRERDRAEDKKKIELIKNKNKKKGNKLNDDKYDDKYDDDKDFNVETVVENVIKGKNGSKNDSRSNKPSSTKSNNSSYKDKKFGFGGKARKLAKRNSKSSVNDLSQFSKYNAKPKKNNVSKARRSGRK